MNNTTKKLALYTSGIMIAYLASSLITEKLYNTEYPHYKGKKTEKFFYPSLVVWISALFCTVYGTLRSKYWDKKPSPISYREQATLGALFTLNYLPAHFALLYMPYHVQVIAKNTRYIFVIIVGVFFSRVKKGDVLRLPPSKLIIGSMITIGAVIFTVFQSKSKSGKDTYQDAWIGYLMILCSIVCDAFFSDSQAYSKKMFKPSANHLFTAANKFAFIFVFGTAAVTGELIPSLEYLWTHPTANIDLLGLCLLQLVGQICIYLVVAEFKQHIYPLISTVRKILTILLSIIVFGHTVVYQQWFGMSLVFGGMIYEFYDQIKSHEEIDRKKKEAQSLDTVPDQEATKLKKQG